MSAGFVANAGGDLTQLSHLKMEEGDSVEEINPWNREVNFLEKVLNNHDSIMKEGKDDREVESKERVSVASKVKVSIEVTTSVEARASKPKVGACYGTSSRKDRKDISTP